MTKLLTFVGVLAIAYSGSAQAVPITGGQTSVALDTNLFASVGLTLSGNTGPVISPGELPGSVALAFSSRRV